MKDQIIKDLVRRHVRDWQWLLRLGGWRITCSFPEKVYDEGKEVTAKNDYEIKLNGFKWSRITFSMSELRHKKPYEIEEVVIHEVNHILDHGCGTNAHKLIYRQERHLRYLRQRAGMLEERRRREER